MTPTHDVKNKSTRNDPESSTLEDSGFKSFPEFGVAKYHPQAVEEMFTVNPFKFKKGLNFKRTQLFYQRFFTVLSIFIKMIFNAWIDRQIWSYLGAEDIDRAQSVRRRKHAHWLTEQLLMLGPTFIKVGQSVSTRVDLIRKEYIEELSKLQDRVPPISFKEVHRILREELDDVPENIFETINPIPLAAASLGQVHRVQLKVPVTSNEEEGPENSRPLDDETQQKMPYILKELVLKIQRPNLLDTFYVDLAILRKIARFFQKNTELGRGREWLQIVDEFGKTLFEEIDYIQEGRNADTFRKNLAHIPSVHVPEVYWNYTSHRVIAYEYAPGIKINDIPALELKELDREFLSEECVKIFFQQILLDGFYHADPHPGNLAVRDDGVIILYDFGMVGRLPEHSRKIIVECFLNIINKKPEHILNNLIELDMLGPNADLDVIRQLIEWALDNYYDIPHEQLNFEYLTDELSEIMYAHPFKLPANFTFMIRSLITLEGVATHLYPGIQFMSVAVEYARNFIGQTLDLKFLMKKGKDILGGLSANLLASSSPSSRKASSRVKLQYDEWVPLSRYVKAGFLLLGFGQLLIFSLCLIILGTAMPKLTPLLVISAFLISLYGLFLMSTLILFPAYKKPIRFQPTVTPPQKKR
jgi:predicted unusual protein kinase regulating ubiquinone biosynthesis (AarF/ABC1/UbiB family)